MVRPRGVTGPPVATVSSCCPSRRRSEPPTAHDAQLERVVPPQIRLALQPAEQHRWAVEHRRKVEQQRCDALDLDTAITQRRQEQFEAGSSALSSATPPSAVGVSRSSDRRSSAKSARCPRNTSIDGWSSASIVRASSTVKIRSTPTSIAASCGAHGGLFRSRRRLASSTHDVSIRTATGRRPGIDLRDVSMCLSTLTNRLRTDGSHRVLPGRIRRGHRQRNVEERADSG